MKKKALIFVDRFVSTDDFQEKQKMQDQGYIVNIVDGNFTKGFEDSCDTVVLCGDFPHVASWAESKGVEIVKAGAKPKSVEKPEPVNEEEKPDAVDNEKPQRRVRKPKTEEVTK